MEVDIKIDDDIIQDLNYLLQQTTILTVNKFISLYKKTDIGYKIDELTLSQNIIMHLFEKYNLN